MLTRSGKTTQARHWEIKQFCDILGMGCAIDKGLKQRRTAVTMLRNRGSTELQKLLSIEFHTQLLSQDSQILFPAFLLAEGQFSHDLHNFLILSIKLSFLQGSLFSSLSRQLISLRSWNCFIRKLTMNSKFSLTEMNQHQQANICKSLILWLLCYM